MSMLAEASLHPDRLGADNALARTRGQARSFVRLFVRCTIVGRRLVGRLAGTFARDHVRASVLYARDYKSLTNECIPFVITIVGTPVRRCSLLYA